jgi:hypothetical protein
MAVVLKPMVWVSLVVELGDVHWRLKPLGVGGNPDCRPERLGAEVIYNGAPAPLLRSAGLRLSIVLGLNCVTDVAVVAYLVVRGRTLRGRLVPSLL